MIEVTEPLPDPAGAAARIASRASRAMDGRKVDVLLNILISALKAGHAFVPVLLATAQRFAAQIAKLTP